MLGLYLSGTGNTKHCIEKLTNLLDGSAKVIPLECTDIIEEIKKNKTIILGLSDTVFKFTLYVERFYKTK